jgi:hypothetical protein
MKLKYHLSSQSLHSGESLSFIHWFIPQMFTEHLWGARSFTGLWEHRSEEHTNNYFHYHKWRQTENKVVISEHSWGLLPCPPRDTKIQGCSSPSCKVVLCLHITFAIIPYTLNHSWITCNTKHNVNTL